MKDIKIKIRQKNNLKESKNPLNIKSDIENNSISKSENNFNDNDSGKQLKDKSQILNIPEKYSLENPAKKELFPEKNSYENIIYNTTQNDILNNKKERYKLEQRMKYDLNIFYDGKKIEKKLLHKNELKNGIKNKHKNKIDVTTDYSSEMINEIKKNRNFLLKQLIIIQIPLMLLSILNIILFKILYNNNDLDNLYLYISSLVVSCILTGLNLFLIMLILLGIFNHYYTSNIFRFLCLVNFAISISLIIIQIILIGNFKSNIKIEIEKKKTKIIIYILIVIITGIIILINILLGIIAKDSLLIIGGWKKENSCPERKIKRAANKIGENYIYFNEEMDIDTTDTNLKALRKFHAHIYSNNIS